MKKYILFLIGIFCFSCNNTDDDKNTAQPSPYLAQIGVSIKSTSGEDMLNPENENAFSLDDIIVERKDDWHTDYVLDDQPVLGSFHASFGFTLQADLSQTFFRITLPNGNVHILEAYVGKTSKSPYLVYVKELKHNSETIFSADAAYYLEQGGTPPSLTLIVE